MPLGFLFPIPPDPVTANVEYTLKVDPTFGSTVGASDNSNNPEASEFGFFVLASQMQFRSHWTNAMDLIGRYSTALTLFQNKPKRYECSVQVLRHQVIVTKSI